MTQPQQLYTEYWKDAEYFKSKNIDVREYRYNVRYNYMDAIQKYMDIGVVKEVY